MDFISIVIPAYNAQRWLARCLDSVLDAADVECEIVVVDDGSLDATPRIIEEFADKDPRVTTVRTDHLGPCASRLEGVRQSTGDYILFVDSDDTLPHDAIAIFRQLLRDPSIEEKNVDSLRSHPRLTDTSPHIVIANIIRRTDHDDRLLIRGERRALTGLELAVEILEGEMPRFLVGHLFSRELMESIEWDNNPKITQLEHAYMMLSLAMKVEQLQKEGRGDRLVVVDPTRNVYNYLIRPGSQSSMMSPTHDGFEAIWRHITALDLPDRELTLWGLRILRDFFIHRGIPFSDNFAMAADLRERTRRMTTPLPEDLKEIVNSLSSRKKRLKIGRRLSRTAPLSDVAPHITFVIPTRGSTKKVKRSVKSIYDTGFRNIEVILVDTNDDYRTSLALNEINVAYPRVRIVRTAPFTPIIQANLKGLMESKGLAIMFIRPGDRVYGPGAYRALVHIDQGADLVLVNIRRFSPVTRRIGKSESNISLFGPDISETTNYREYILEKMAGGHHELAPRLRANIWRREMLVESDIPAVKLDNSPVDHLASATIQHILSRPINVVVQAPDALPSYDIALTDSTLKGHLFPTGQGAEREHFFESYLPQTGVE